MKSKQILYLLYLIYFVGLAGHIIKDLRPLMLALTPFTLLLTGALVLYFTYKQTDIRFLMWCLVIYILTFALEVTGTKTGFVFGNYAYGNTLGPKLLSVPVIIGFNWVIVILGAIIIAEQIDQNIWLTALLTGTLAVLFDIILEPVAIKLDYWKWTSGTIPLYNYYSWFGISFIASLLYDLFKIQIYERLPESFFTIQFMFFIFLYVFIN